MLLSFVVCCPYLDLVGITFSSRVVAVSILAPTTFGTKSARKELDVTFRDIITVSCSSFGNDLLSLSSTLIRSFPDEARPGTDDHGGVNCSVFRPSCLLSFARSIGMVVTCNKN
jgi:hypothetical protein